MQVWNGTTLRVPPRIASLFPEDAFGAGAGAFVDLGDVAPAPLDSMKFTFTRRDYPQTMPKVIPMAWVILDARPVEADPFVVIATRVLEPLIAELREINELTDHRRIFAIAELENHVEELAASLRAYDNNPQKLRKAIRVGLTSIAGIVLNIIANRLDPLIDEIDWPAVYNTIEDVFRRVVLT